MQDYSLNTTFLCANHEHVSAIYIVIHHQAEHVVALQTYKVVLRL
jgi:hypothetical protein